ncbi:hypothetical protein FUAX_12430 [Fulvitalea axinellae]|uniref:Lipocalin-like domain-containing protein n=1 Tax=Fulvitalea axinellae TaxID=1182444 RepID=A0AAU9C9J2_9BACT|nr:hypothetical protein FUAX_12430 [Fulvitalea axinellae]
MRRLYGIFCFFLILSEILLTGCSESAQMPPLDRANTLLAQWDFSDFEAFFTLPPNNQALVPLANVVDLQPFLDSYNQGSILFKENGRFESDGTKGTWEIDLENNTLSLTPTQTPFDPNSSSGPDFGWEDIWVKGKKIVMEIEKMTDNQLKTLTWITFRHNGETYNTRLRMTWSKQE